MVEVQKHGFTFEGWIKEILGVDKTGKYTQKWDIPGKIPISVKFIGKTNALELSSAVRFWENERPFLLIVGRWEQIGNNKKIVSIDELMIDKKILTKLKGNLNLKELKEFNKKIVSFPNGRDGQREGIAYAKKWKKENAHKIGLITLTHKIDSKDQRRLQCNINYKNYLKLFGQPSGNTTFKGQSFNGVINSPKRVLNKK